MEEIVADCNIAKLVGAKSQQLFNDIQSMEHLNRCEHIIKFFQSYDGSEEFWAMTHILNGDGPRQDTEKLRVHHISDVTAAYSSKA